MIQEIDLDGKHLLLLKIQYTRHVNFDKESYELSTKIVRADEYRKDNKCIGEIEGEFSVTIPHRKVRIPIVCGLYEAYFDNKIKRKIDDLVAKSRNIVYEWNLNDETKERLRKYIIEYYIK